MDYSTSFNQMSKHLFKVNPANPNQRHNFIITDFIANYDDIKDIPEDQFQTKERTGCCSGLFRFIKVVNPSYWIFLVLLGLITAFLGFFIDYSSQEMRKIISNICLVQLSWWPGYLMWVFFSLLFMMVAASVGQFISRDAEGSGIPEVKSILAGVNIYKYLSFQTLIGKIIGLFSALVAGVSIGKEGPFVHLAAGVANKLAKLKCFSKIEKNPAIKKQMLAAAVAAGVASTFGAPMGGVLFSIEVTATYYMVSNLWKAFFCATWSVVAFKIVQGLQRAQLFTETSISNIVFGWHMFGYVGVGLFSGIIGALFVTVVGKIIYLRKKIQVTFFSNRWGYSGFVAFITAFCSFPIIFLQDGDRNNLMELFQPTSLSQINQKKWADPAQGFNLFTFTFLKFVLTALAVSCPIPAGVFTPIFTLGASFGRLFGFSFWYYFRNDTDFTHNYIAMYAVIGAAGVASSVTRTLSVCVIVFELTGQVTFLMPLLICVLVSYAISNSLSVSFFDLLLDMKNLPYIPALRSKEAYSMDAGDIMNRNFIYLTRDSTLSDIAILLQYVGTQPKSIPVVETPEQKLLLFQVQAQSLKKYLLHQYNRIQSRLDPETKRAMKDYFKTISDLSQTNRQQWFSQSFALQSVLIKSGNVTPRRSRFLSRQSSGFDGIANHQMLELSPIDERRIEMQHLAINEPETQTNQVVDQFWNSEIDYNNEVIEVDKAPFCVFEQTPMAKIHFLFTMLNLTQLIVLSKGITMGIITKSEFLKNKQVQNYSGEGGAQVGGAGHL